MSGHSKWANIKRKKGSNDAKKAGLFTKIGREIAVAVKQGGADQNMNPRLRDIIAKAKSNNMPNDNISRSIKKASGELKDVNYEEITYEGYAAGGVAVIVETLTDKKNRTAGDVRHHFDKCGGALGTTGCVSYMFERKGLIVIEASMDFDELMLIALEAGADDVEECDDVFEVYTTAANFTLVRELFESNNEIIIISADLEMIPGNTVDPKENLPRVLKLLDLLEDNDDVQKVYHNAELPEEAEE